MPFNIVYFPEIMTFLFVFAVLFGLLGKAKLFSSSRVNAIIAAALAAFAAASSQLVSFFSANAPAVAGAFVVLFVIILARDAFEGGDKKEKKRDRLPQIAAIVVLLAVVGAFADQLPSIPGISSDNLLWLIGILFVLFILYAVYHHTAPVAAAPPQH